MPIALVIWGAAAAAGMVGIGKGIKAGSNNSKAKEYIDDAKYIYDKAKYRLEDQQRETAQDLESLGKTKLYCWSNTIGSFVDIFSKFKNVRFENVPNIDAKLQKQLQGDELKNMAIASIKAQEVVKGGIGALGAGALAGIASYGGVMMFASASTGTAIASLSGVAATNATLAWLGGGSLAAGGFGVAGGTIALGGIVLAPILAVAGFIMAAKSEENLAQAKQHYQEAVNAVEKMETIISFLSRVSELSSLYEDFIISFDEKLNNISNKVEEMYERELKVQSKGFINAIKRVLGNNDMVNYSKLSTQDKQILHIYCLSAQLLNSILAAPLLDKQGNLVETAEATLIEAQKSSVKLLS
jgi:hypothetical protein